MSLVNFIIEKYFISTICSPSLRYLSKLVSESCHVNPAVRPSALRVKKSLARLLPSQTVPGNPIKMV